MKPNVRKIVLTSAAVIAAVAVVSAGVWTLTSYRTKSAGQSHEAQGIIYTCPMHPNYLSNSPGNCPICGMELVPVKGAQPAEATATNTGEKRILYYRDSMNPSYISDKPGRAPDGMDLVPVYEGEDTGNLVKIDPAMVQNIGVQTEKAARRILTRHIRTSATVMPDERRISLVTTKIMGYIEKLYVNYTGQVVKKGQPLFDLYSPDLVSAQTEYLQIFHSKTLSGSGQLLESVRQRLLNWDITPEQITALEQRGTPQRTLTIVSPAEGLVTEKMVIEGQNIEPGMDLYRIVDFSRVWVEGAIYQQDVPLVSVGQNAEIELDYYPGEQFTGTVTYISPEMDMDSRTLLVRLELPNPGLRIKTGMNATVMFHTVVDKNAVTVPEQSVIRSGLRTLVIIARGGGYFEPREVTTGQTAEGNTEVLNGVQEGEEIVVTSQFLIDSESNLNAAVRQLTARQDSTAAMPGGAPAPDSTMKGMDMSGMKIAEPAAQPGAVLYTCPMHPEVISEKPGSCPKCGMALVPKKSDSEVNTVVPENKETMQNMPGMEH